MRHAPVPVLRWTDGGDLIALIQDQIAQLRVANIECGALGSTTDDFESPIIIYYVAPGEGGGVELTKWIESADQQDLCVCVGGGRGAVGDAKRTRSPHQKNTTNDGENAAGRTQSQRGRARLRSEPDPAPVALPDAVALAVHCVP